MPNVEETRSFSEGARNRLLIAALRLFVEKGYAQTSIRDIAQAAEANVASVAYYFRDKEGLYRTALYEPLHAESVNAKCLEVACLPLREALKAFMSACLRPLSMGEAAQLSIRLRFREMLEPTGMLKEEQTALKELHEALIQMLMRHFGISQTDDELCALAFAIFGLVTHLYSGRDRIRSINAELMDRANAASEWVERLTRYAETMVASEVKRRRAAVKKSQAQTSIKEKVMASPQKRSVVSATKLGTTTKSSGKLKEKNG
jgi:AcrR family transcriptional regulator